MPVAGRKLVTTAMFRNVWRAIWVVTPTTIRLPNRSRAWMASQNPRSTSRAKISIIRPAPTSPSSSKTTAKMKSLCSSGRNMNFCRLLPRPTPRRPPEPTVMRL